MTLINKVSHSIVGETVNSIQTDVIVLDCSFWQDRDDTPQKINFQKMKDAGAKGVILRAGQNNWDDEDFLDYYRESKGILPRGIYWFYDSRTTPTSQALRVYNLIKDDLCEMEIWADYEERYNGPYKGWCHFAVFISELEKLLPKAKIGIYTGYWYWLENSPNPITQKASLDWFGKYPLWLAWYINDPKYVKIPKPWTKLDFWQFTDNGDGLKYGVESLNVDLNYFNGSEEEFNKRYLNDYTPPVDDPTDPEEPVNDVKVKYKGKVNSNVFLGLQVRESAVIGKKIATLKANESFEGDNIVTIQEKEWMHIIKPVDGWIAAWYTKYEKVNNVIDLPLPQIGRNRIKHDTELAKYGYKSRLNSGDYKLDAYPEVIRYNSTGNKSNLDLSEKWKTFVKDINTSQAYKFMQVSESGWHNSGDWPRVEYVSFGGSFVEVTRIDGDRCYIKHYSNDQLPPDITKDFYDDTLIQIFTVTRRDNTVEAPPCGLCKTIIISRTSDEELWIHKDYLTFVGQDNPKYPQIITVNYGMNIREFHDVTAKIVGRIPQFGKTQIEEVFQDGENYWGRVGLSTWICLKLNGQFFTSWRP